MNEVPVVSSISSCDSVKDMLRTLHTETSKLNIKRFSAYAKAGLEADELEENMENLYALSENYEEKYEL